MISAEILLILIVALIVLGPKRMQEVAYQITQLVMYAKKHYHQFQTHLEQQQKQILLAQNEARARDAESSLQNNNLKES